MPPKNKKHNAFYYFMIEYRQQEEKKGRTFRNMEEVTPEAGDKWKAMTADQRRPYDNKAKQGKGNGKVVKYTSTGESVDQILRQEQEEMEKEKKMKDYIENLISDSGDFSRMEFFVANVNYYCYCNSTNRYIPAEISIVRFSLQDGVDLDDIFHVILDSGPLPIGYNLTAQQNSGATHQIPLPPHNEDLQEHSLKYSPEVLDRMIEFLTKNIRGAEPLPPIFVEDCNASSNITVAKNVFSNMLMDFGKDPEFLSIYSLSYLFFVLRNAASTRGNGDTRFRYISIVQSEFDRDVYEYARNIACKFHNPGEANLHCTLSKAIRKIFIICDHCCGDLGINLICGRHVPLNAQLIQVAAASRPPARAQSAMSSVPSEVNSEETAASTAASTASTAARREARLPITQSVAMPSLDDFPPLGNPERPRAIGRGRGRILAANFPTK